MLETVLLNSSPRPPTNAGEKPARRSPRAAPIAFSGDATGRLETGPLRLAAQRARGALLLSRRVVCSCGSRPNAPLSRPYM